MGTRSNLLVSKLLEHAVKTFGKYICAPALALLLHTPKPAFADPKQNDPWFAPDKALHFAAGGAIACGGYGLAALGHGPRDLRIGLGVSLGIGASFMKEALDAAGFGTPSGRDFAWGVIGTAVGIGISISLDLALTP